MNHVRVRQAAAKHGLRADGFEDGLFVFARRGLLRALPQDQVMEIHAQLIDPGQEITRLLGDLLGDLGTTRLVLGRHQLGCRRDKATRPLGEPKRLHRRRHAL